MKINILLFCSLFFSCFSSADSWVQKANFEGTPRWGVSYFTINGKAYVGMGIDDLSPYNYRTDMWEYNPVTNVWSQVADFPGIPRYTTIEFSIGTKGYVGTGRGQSSTVYFSDLWQYDQPANTWAQKNDFPLPARLDPAIVSINGKIYAGFGYSPNSMLNDWYSYNDTTDVWTPLSSFPGAARNALIGFEINGLAYVGTGLTSFPNPLTSSNDFWAYNPLTNLWIPKSNLPGPPRFNGVGFSLNNKGYVGGGENVIGGIIIINTDFYEYDPILDTWTSKADIPVDIAFSSGFVLGNRGFIACGIDSFLNLSGQVWEYTPDSTTGINEVNPISNQLQVNPNPVQNILQVSNCSGDIISIMNSSGTMVIESPVLSKGTDQSINVSFLKPGIYFVKSNNQVIKIFKE